MTTKVILNVENTEWCKAVAIVTHLGADGDPLTQEVARDIPEVGEPGLELYVYNNCTLQIVEVEKEPETDATDGEPERDTETISNEDVGDIADLGLGEATGQPSLAEDQALDSSAE